MLIVIMIIPVLDIFPVGSIQLISIDSLKFNFPISSLNVRRKNIRMFFSRMLSGVQKRRGMWHLYCLKLEYSINILTKFQSSFHISEKTGCYSPKSKNSKLINRKLMQNELLKSKYNNLKWCSWKKLASNSLFYHVVTRCTMYIHLITTSTQTKEIWYFFIQWKDDNWSIGWNGDGRFR